MKGGVALIWDSEKAESFALWVNKVCGSDTCTLNGARVTFRCQISESDLSTLLSGTRLNEAYAEVKMEDIEIVEDFIYRIAI